ncbi:MAG: outer membrane beta-barrel protein [Terracidiphilus sp.]
MKSKFLFLILAVFAVVMMPLTATSQIAPDKPPRTEAAEASPKYEIFVGAGYTSLNNVNQSRNGQLGVDVSVTRDWGKYFGITADGGTYKYPYDATNPGNPTVDMLLFGPVIHAHLLGRADVFLHVLLGCEHISGTAVATGGSSTTSTGPYATPNVSFAGGYGGGFDYRLTSRFYVRAWGDDIRSAITADLPPSCANMGCSSNETRSARAGLGVVYKF